MLKAIIAALLIIIVGIYLLIVYIKSCLVSTAVDQVDKIKEYVFEQVDDLQIIDKIDAVKEYLSKLNK